MKYEIFACVQLPDGSHLYLPVIRHPDANQPKRAEFESKKSALEWAEFCLPAKLLIQEIEDT
jgi:hypothetical protein